MDPEVSRKSRFTTTRWTLVLAAGQSDSPDGRKALGVLCQTYWFPIYAYLRRRGYDEHQAADYTQGFFAHLLEGSGLQNVKREKCRFRSFLLACLKNFLADDWRRTRAAKRGGGKRFLPLEITDAENSYTLEPGDNLSPDLLFDRSWALTLLGGALGKLRSEYTRAGRGEVFECLKGHIAREQGTSSYDHVAAQLGMTEGAVRTAVHRLRSRLRDLVQAEIAETVATPEQLEEEIKDLFTVLGG